MKDFFNKAKDNQVRQEVKKKLTKNAERITQAIINYKNRRNN